MVSLTSKRAALLATAGLLAISAEAPADAATAAARHRAAHHAVPASADTGGTISSIDVVGNQRIETDTIRSYMLVSAGEAYNQADIDRSLKTLYATGLFRDVSFSRSGKIGRAHV